MKQLKTAQRFWLLFVIAFFASTIATIALRWPRSDAAVVAALEAPECAALRDPAILDPANRMPETAPVCTPLRALIQHDRVALPDVAAYDSHRFRGGMLDSLNLLLWWAGFVGLLYVLGWSSSRVIATLQKRNRARSG